MCNIGNGSKPTVYVVDMDHTFLNLTNLMSMKLDIPVKSFGNPIMEVEGVDYQKILNAWNGHDSVYRVIIDAMSYFSYNEFRSYRMPCYFNENVFNLLENELVVFVSSSFTKQGTELKSEIVSLYRDMFNSRNGSLVPSELITFADKVYEEHSYKNVLSRLHLLGYDVVCVDDNLTRLGWADELGCDTLLVPQVWNESDNKYKKVGTLI